eukprot:Pgem_evm1s1765
MKFSCAVVSTFAAFAVAQKAPQNKQQQKLLAVKETDIIAPTSLALNSFPKSFVFEVHDDANCTNASPTTESYPILTCHQLAPVFASDRDCLNYLNFKIYSGSPEPQEVAAANKTKLLPKTEVFRPFETCEKGNTKFELQDGSEKYYKFSSFGWDMYAVNGTKVKQLTEIEKNTGAQSASAPRTFGQIANVNKILMFEKPQNCVLTYQCSKCKCNTKTFVTESFCSRYDSSYYTGKHTKNGFEPGISNQWVCEGADNAMTCSQKQQAPANAITIKSVQCTQQQITVKGYEPCTPTDPSCIASIKKTNANATPKPGSSNSNSLT